MTKNILILITLLITQSNLIYSSEPQIKSDNDLKRSSPASQISSPCASPLHIGTNSDSHNHSSLAYFARECVKAQNRGLTEMKMALINSHIKRLLAGKANVHENDQHGKSFADYALEDLDLENLLCPNDQDINNQKIIAEVASEHNISNELIFQIIRKICKDNNFEAFLLKFPNNNLMYLINTQKIEKYNPNKNVRHLLLESKFKKGKVKLFVMKSFNRFD